MIIGKVIHVLKTFVYTYALYFLVAILFDFLLQDTSNYAKLALYSLTFSLFWTIYVERYKDKK